MNDGPQQLWCAVLYEAVQDALHGPAKIAGLSDTIDAARAYILGKHRDFVTVCHRAGLDPDAVREAFLKLLAHHEAKPARKAPASRPRTQARRGVAPQLYTYQGQTLSLVQWAEIKGLTYCALNTRIKKGWTLERALTTPGRTKTDPAILAEMAAFEPEVMSDQEAAALAQEQAKQTKPAKRQARTFTHDGRTLTVRQWAAAVGLDRLVLHHRLKGGWPIEEALTAPVGARFGPKPQQASRASEGPREVNPPLALTVPPHVGLEPAAPCLPELGKQDDPASPKVNATMVEPGVPLNLAGRQGTGGGTASQEITEIPFALETTP